MSPMMYRQNRPDDETVSQSKHRRCQLLRDPGRGDGWTGEPGKASPQQPVEDDHLGSRLTSSVMGPVKTTQQPQGFMCPKPK
ncbi:hypothetical protein THAOC_18974 [Thalassiosira oceanica]|uniref:Uncharacterized protein n=1 Tax=Thalassiosira oceanica TaxID=159749 RepID=K0SQM4_THAOC|nr:hypothetical protein THAOC_18974 [Thalassiosira oceanica]|eukprot:EJK60632.1 hypothetical protein THAOC_18974 [Thalassiosira oceanica]